MFFAKRATVISALSAAVLIGSSVMSAIPANAASLSVRPAFGTVCGGDACIQTASKGGTYANVNAWANTTTFSGHFELQNVGCGYPGLHIANSSTGTWPAGGTHYTFKNIIWHGMGCGGDSWAVIAWKKTSSGFSQIGFVSFQI
jgi:hypothetical protein